jgi:hypothetical protein
MRFFDLKKPDIGRLKGESGIGLAETLVALAILGISASAFITALSTGAISVRIQDELALSQGLAQSEMEVIKAAPFDVTGQSYPVLNGPSGYTITIQTDSSVYGDSRIQQVTVTVLHDASAVLTLENYKVNR